MTDPAVIARIKKEFEGLGDELDERELRLWAARAALESGPSAVFKATGISRSRISRGIEELKSGEQLPQGRKRRPGGGRKSASESDPDLAVALDELMNPKGRGRHQAPLRWTCRSSRRLARDLTDNKHEFGYTTVRQQLRAGGYRVRSNRRVGQQAHPDRDKQFAFINQRVTVLQREGQPCIFVDLRTKQSANSGMRSDQAQDGADQLVQLAAASVSCWWERLGHKRHPRVRRLFVAVEAWVSDVSVRWKHELQQLSDSLGLEVEVCHLLPGIYKWSRIEHHLVCCPPGNRQSRPPELSVNLIGSATSKSGLEEHTKLPATSRKGDRKMAGADLTRVNLQPADFHGEWNYTIRPRGGKEV